MRVDGTTRVFVREPDGRVREWVNDGTEQHVPGRRFFDANHVRVALDGVVLESFLAADDVEGWVRRYRRDADGQLVVREWLPDDAGPALDIETLRGRVEFVWPEAPR